jgi:hypothetical protein
MGTGRPQVVAGSVEKLVAYAESDLGLPVSAEGDRYLVGDGVSDLAAFGIVGDWLAFSSSVGTLDAIDASPARRLADDDAYSEAVMALPPGLDVYMYVDIVGIVRGFVDDPDTVTALDAFRAFIVGGGVDGDRIVSSGLVLIDDPSGAPSDG